MADTSTGVRRRVATTASEARPDFAASALEEKETKETEAKESKPRVDPPEGTVGDKANETAEVKKKRKGKKRQAPPLRFNEICSMAMTVITACITAYSTYVIIQQMRSRPNPSVSSSDVNPIDADAAGPETLWTKEQLALYNGSDPQLPLLLGCIGEVFDVSKGKKHYAPGEGYNHFCGRDASRAFITGNFTGEGLTDDLSRLTYDQLISVAGWRDFYRKTYRPVGKLMGRFFNESGHPTKNLTRFERQLKRANESKKQQEEADKEYEGCNSYWSQADGGKVYCEQGYPRMLFDMMRVGDGQTTQRTRCICLDEAQIRARGDLKVYDGCNEWSTSCVTSPPETS